MRACGFTCDNVLRLSVYALATLIGIMAIGFPLIWPAVSIAGSDQGYFQMTPMVLALLVGLCFVAMLLEVQSDDVNTKFVALLGVLVALNAVLRFAEIAIPGPAGFSPIFFLIILTGYVYGARFGFLMGALTLLVSALITGGVGPWLPYQMLASGWVGLSVVGCRWLVRRLHAETHRFEIVALAVWGAGWGLLYGVIMNLASWPFISGLQVQVLGAERPFIESLRRYATFYVATSLVWDLGRVVGNAAMILAFGAPTLRTLRRFQRRFTFVYRPKP